MRVYELIVNTKRVRHSEKAKNLSKMVKDVWARCEFCFLNTHDKADIYVPSCVRCNTDNENFLFHKSCLFAIYDENTHTISKAFRKFVKKIKCGNCLCEQFTVEMLW